MHSERADRFIGMIQLREIETLLGWLDVLYCMHWFDIEKSINNNPNQLGINGYIIEQRRIALEWCFSDDDWNQIQLDT
jgi:hypothetical protein